MRRAMPAAAALLLVLGLLAASDAEAGRDRASRRHSVSAQSSSRAATLRQRGLEHFVNREYQLAADDLMEAYRLDQRESTLFGWGEAVRETGDCDLAKRIYRHLLDSTGDSSMARRAESGISACEAADAAGITSFLASRPSSPEADGVLTIEPVGEEEEEPPAKEEPIDAEPAEPTVMVSATAPGNPHRKSYILMGAGAFATLAGVATYVTAGGEVNSPNATHAEVTSARSDADWRRLIAASVAVVGGTVTLVGVLQYRRERRRARPQLAVTPFAGGHSAGVMVSGGF